MLRALTGSCHPAPTVAVTLVAVLLGVGVGLPAGALAVLAAAVFTGQLSIGWSNDALDVRRDEASGRRDKPAARGAVTPRVLATAAGTALAVTVVLSLLLGWRAGLALLVLVAAGWAYNLGLKATWASGVAYLVGFGALPVAPYLARAGHVGPPWWVPVTGALLGLAAHVANVLPDLDDDVRAGIRGLPHRLGPRASLGLMALALVGAGAAVLVGGRSLPLAIQLVGAVLIAGGAVAATVIGFRRPDSAVAFRLVIAVALVDVVLFVLAV